ncbi:MAG: hypothetical protein AB7I57_21500, partial [Pirellulales bacterium]
MSTLSELGDFELQPAPNASNKPIAKHQCLAQRRWLRAINSPADAINFHRLRTSVYRIVQAYLKAAAPAARR